MTKQAGSDVLCAPPKKKLKKIYGVDQERWNVSVVNDDQLLAEETLFLEMEEAAFEDKLRVLGDTRSFLQTQFRSKQPQEIATDLVHFWSGGPRLLSFWFVWVTAGDEGFNLADNVEENLNKIMNLTSEFLITKKGESFEKEIESAKSKSLEDAGNSTMFHVFLLRELAKLWKNKPEQVIFLSGADQVKDMSDNLPCIHVRQRNVMGASDFAEEVVVGVRIGDVSLYSDIGFTEAIAAVVQLYFVMNIHYPPECDDVYQFLQRIACKYGCGFDDGARNRRNQTRKCFRDFESFLAKQYVESRKGDIVKIFN